VTAESSVPFVRAYGDPFDIGRAHGVARGPALRAFIDDSLCRLNRILYQPVSMGALRSTIDAYDSAITAATPDLATEIEGLAEGAGIDRAHALLLQIRREILGYRTVPTMGECTTYARAGQAFEGHPVLAQTIDLNGDLDDQIAVLEVGRSGTSTRALVLSFGGLLGYLGLNSRGLAVGLNLVLGGTWRPGLPPYLAIRHLLDTAGSVDEAIATLRRLPLASSRHIMLCDRDKAASVEILDAEPRVVEASETVHTNHFLHPDLVPHDQLNVFALRSSRSRLRACTDRLTAIRRDARAGEHFVLLAAPPIRVAGSGDIRRERTVAAVVLLPQRGELHLRSGDPASTRTRVFRLGNCNGSATPPATL
jgi:isopenicillin-N N-acyltransferase-like protein